MTEKITIDPRKRVEQRIEKWRGKRAEHLRCESTCLAKEVEGWLFGMKVGLELLGLHSLAKLADESNEFDTNEQ